MLKIDEEHMKRNNENIEAALAAIVFANEDSHLYPMIFERKKQDKKERTKINKKVLSKKPKDEIVFGPTLAFSGNLLSDLKDCGYQVSQNQYS